jgi:ABC-type amino acid transport substrate-binding protein
MCNDMVMTLKTGALSVATAFPNPPWDVYNSKTGETGGFDIELISAICGQMNLTLQKIQYKGENFNDIFAGLSNGSYDVVISGTTITPERSQVAFVFQALSRIQSNHRSQSSKSAKGILDYRFSRFGGRHSKR